MRIAVIGTGKMGRGFTQALVPTHEVVVGSRTLGQLGDPPGTVVVDVSYPYNKRAPVH